MAPAGETVRVGLVSDTHGHLPASAHRALAGVRAIVHAGDVGGLAIIDELETIAPVTAVRGNCDTGRTRWLPEVANVEIGGVRFLVGHVKTDLVRGVDPIAAGVGVVVTGHSHKARIERVGGVLYVNPGTAGASRSGGGLTCAIVTIRGGVAEVEIFRL